MQIRRSLWITFAFSNASTISLFLLTLFLARILTPKDIGVFSMSVIIINLAGVLRDLGTSPYLISKSEVTEADTGAVLGLTLTTSWVLAVTLWFSRHAIADYFGEPLMADVLVIQLIGFLLIPVAAILSSLLTRNLSAGRSAAVSLISTAVYGTVLVTLAIDGFGALAPAWANASILVANIVTSWALMPKGFKLWPRWSGWGEPVRYGGGVVLMNLATVGNTSLPDAVIGRTLGAHDVGLFSRGNGTVSLFTQVVGPTLNYNALPIIAKTFHTGSGALVAMVTKSSELLTVLAWPTYAWIAVFPTEIITLLYGQTWVEAAALAPWLCLAAAARAPFLIIGPALQAVNKPAVAATAAILGLGARVLVLAVFGFKDLLQFVMLLTIADLIGVAGWAYAAKRYLGLGFVTAFVSQRRSLLVGGSCLAASLLVHFALRGQGASPLLAVLVSGLAIVVVFVSSLYFSRHPFWAELMQGVDKLKGATAAK